MSTTTTLTPSRNFTDELQPPPTDVAYLTTVLVNVAFVGTPYAGRPINEWVLIDAGIPYQAARIMAFARARFGDAPPRAILLTHGHFDHVGSLHGLLAAWPDTPVYAHNLEIPYITGHASYPPPDPSVGGGAMARMSPLFPRGPYDFRPNVMPLASDGIVPYLPDWRWVHTPGHSPGHVSFFRESDRTLVAGDAFVTQKQESLTGVMTAKHTVHGPPTYFTQDWVSARSSVELLAALRPQYAITGHGPAVANPVLAHDLGLLTTQFERYAVPPDGRYVREPAWFDASGPTYVPPPLPDARPKVIGALALSAVALGVAAWAARRSDDD
jgi:glyoxylase-like metal-dependent hydrolase (beta-lactamase superfamily II)